MTDGVAVQQMLHGYRNGHRLLASSTTVPAETQRLIDRLSDAAGGDAGTQTGGYLTGYPLPDRAYALAMTWPARTAPRPNTVWTHTLILSDDVLLSARPDAAARVFREPGTSEADLSLYEQPLDLDLLHGATADPSGYSDQDARAVLAGLYCRPTDAWLSVASAAEALCLSVWAQQWPRLRRGFTFCSRATEPRHLGQRPFDLLLSPQPTRWNSPQEHPAAAVGSEVDALLADLRSPGELRAFLATCGGDSANLASVGFLTGIWLDLLAGCEPRSVIAQVARRAARPASHRKLKRGLLRHEHTIFPERSAAQVVAALSDPAIGRSFLSGDADVAHWVGHAWRLDRQDVARVAALVAPAAGDSAPAGDGPLAPTAATADTAVQPAALDAVRREARSADLGWLAASHPGLAAEVLMLSQEPDWWAAWARLPLQDYRRLLHFAASGPAAAQADLALLSVDDGASRWSEYASAVGRVACGGLIEALADRRVPGPEWAGPLRDNVASLRAAVTSTNVPAQLASAADLCGLAPGLAETPPSAWTPLLAHPSLWDQPGRPVRCAIVLRTALVTPGTEQTVLARAYDRLYPALRDAGNDDAWALLRTVTPRSRDEWDRCRRLALAVLDAAAVAGHDLRSVADNVRDPDAWQALWNAQEVRAAERDKRGRRWGLLDLFGL